MNYKRIKLICLHDGRYSKIDRYFVPAATTKVDYIIDVLNRIGYGVDIISASFAKGGKFAYESTKVTHLGQNTFTDFGCLSFHWKKLARCISRKQVRKHFKKYILENIHEGDLVIAYHSPFYNKTLTKLRKKIKFTLIGEIEEIYQDVKSMGIENDEDEMKFINACDKYIFPTQLLNESINKDSKPSIIIHGLYGIMEDRHVSFGDGKIHVVYAGTFDPRKGGAVVAAAAAYLPENYHIHILGFGTPADTKEIKETVERLQKTSVADITFHGLILGEDFIQFIQKCEIGMSTQNPEAAFNATSFPSKVLNYLSNGLKVVTIDIPAIRCSGVGSYLFYYSEQTPQAIAKAIIEAHNQIRYDGRSLLKKLDSEFVGDMEKFLE